MAERQDVMVKDSQLITQNTRIALSWDFEDPDGQSFSITSANVSIFQEDDTATSIVDQAAVITDLGGGKTRVEITLLEVDTAAFSIGPHHARISMVLGDSQTRKARAALRVRAEDF